MKNLHPIEEGLLEVYQEIARNSKGEKKKDLLDQTDFINDRYQTYLDNKYNLPSITQINYAERSELISQLISCYDNKNLVIQELKTKILLNQELHYQAKCPYCEINSPGTFDHFLPKRKYPDFSVLALNLIPCCEKCNSKKGETWINENSQQSFLNYYYNFIPQEKYLYAKLHFNNNIPSVEYEVKSNPNISNELFDIITSHYLNLDLCARFESHANDEISGWIDRTIMGLQEGLSIKNQKIALQTSILIDKNRTGRNNWKVALYEAIYQSDEMFEYCESVISYGLNK